LTLLRLRPNIHGCPGQVAEWLKAPVSKTKDSGAGLRPIVVKPAPFFVLVARGRLDKDHSVAANRTIHRTRLQRAGLPRRHVVHEPDTGSRGDSPIDWGIFVKGSRDQMMTARPRNLE